MLFRSFAVCLAALTVAAAFADLTNHHPASIGTSSHAPIGVMGDHTQQAG